MLAGVDWKYEEAHISQYLPLAESLARRIAWCEVDRDDLVQEGLVALLKSMREYARPGKPGVDNPPALAAMVMGPAMKWWYTKRDRTTVIEELRPDHAVDTPVEVFAAVYITEFYEHVQVVLGETARRMAEMFVDPGEEVAVAAVHDAEKRRQRAARGERVRGFNTVTVKHEHIRTTLGMKEHEWLLTLEKLRLFTRDFVQRNLN